LDQRHDHVFDVVCSEMSSHFEQRDRVEWESVFSQGPVSDDFVQGFSLRANVKVILD
jgi:hypothetical protein